MKQQARDAVEERETGECESCEGLIGKEMGIELVMEQRDGQEDLEASMIDAVIVAKESRDGQKYL